jgi:hypothetical protein
VSHGDGLEWPYFSLDLPGLTRGGARRLLEVASREGLSLGGSIIDPMEWWSGNMDAETVQAVTRALELAMKVGSLTEEENRIVSLMFGSMREWLEECEL